MSIFDDFYNRAGSSHSDGHGNTSHYDQYGKNVGSSHSDGHGNTNHYDQYGRNVGSSHSDGYGNTRHYDQYGRHAGSSHSDGCGNVRHYDRNGNYIGTSYGVGDGGLGDLSGSLSLIFIAGLLIFCFWFIFFQSLPKLIFPAILFGLGEVVLIYGGPKFDESYFGPVLFIVDGLWVAAWVYLCDVITDYADKTHGTGNSIFGLLAWIGMLIVMVYMCYVFFTFDCDPHDSVICGLNFALGGYGWLASFSEHPIFKHYQWLTLLVLGCFAAIEVGIKKVKKHFDILKK